MVFAIVQSIFAENVRMLKSEASKTAYQGVIIAVISVIIANVLACYLANHAVSLDGFLAVQKNNVGLWTLNCMPFAFGLWGQYSNTLIAHQAGAMLVDQTQDLREKAKNLEKETLYVATHDKLTNLPTRALFYDRVERAILSDINSEKASSCLSILLLEIENFKDIYEALGRNSSDLILKQISKRLQGVSLERDDIAKIDGNIFGIFLSAQTDNGKRAELFARQIQKTMESAFLVEGLQISIHSNIGIVHYPEHGSDVDLLVQRAGIALRVAQKSTKGYAVYSSDFDKQTPLRLTLVSELKQAIERDNLELHYQPQVSIKTGEICGVEGLIRWNHPVHGLVSPEEFIPMAERNRMINPLTQWVIRRAFRDCANWHNQGLPIKVSINLSAKDLHNPELPDLIAGMTVASGIQPSWVKLEITESSVMSDPESALAIIQRLHDMDFEFSIDDFGTGYSSMAYLKRLPLAELKIDKSFVLDILNSENDAAIVKAMIDLGHNLGLLVTAEGVENKDIMRRLMEYGCDIAQGYFLSKALPVEHFNEWVLKDHWKIEDKRSAVPIAISALH